MARIYEFTSSTDELVHRKVRKTGLSVAFSSQALPGWEIFSFEPLEDAAFLFSHEPFVADQNAGLAGPNQRRQKYGQSERP